jgi:hypothetical protein
MVERWLWSSSCIAISAFGWVWMLLGVVSIMRNRSIGKIFLTLSLIGNILLWVVMNGLLYVGIFPRVFVVVEPFISLRLVPIGVYAEVPWADFILHI